MGRHADACSPLPHTRVGPQRFGHDDASDEAVSGDDLNLAAAPGAVAVSGPTDAVTAGVDAGEDDADAPPQATLGAWADGSVRRPAASCVCGVSDETATPPPVAPRLAQTLGLSAQRVQLTKASLFAAPVPVPTFAAVPVAAAPAPGAVRTLGPAPSLVTLLPPAQAVAAMQVRRRVGMSTTTRPPPLASSAVYRDGSAGYIADVGLALGRSCRVGWGPGDVLVHPSSTGPVGSITLATLVPYAIVCLRSPVCLDESQAGGATWPDLQRLSCPLLGVRAGSPLGSDGAVSDRVVQSD
jgi:hypothetical protein